MNFFAEDYMLGRQRCRQWVPLITQQFRLRHVYQILALNLASDTIGSFYYTLHSTTMSAPFYTSEHVTGSNPKWKELYLRDILNTSASCVVLRIWQHSADGVDIMVLTWGVNFSGLCYIGNETIDIQPVYFKRNSVIFCMQGGFYTSHQVVNTELKKPIPFLSNLNLMDTSNAKVIYRKVAMKVDPHEVQNSYNQDKLLRLHRLQMEIKNKSLEVHDIEEKIDRLNGCISQSIGSTTTVDSNIELTVPYAPQLLTMNYLQKIMQERPTVVQKQEMIKISEEIEVARSRTRLLSQEKDRKTVQIRSIKQKLTIMVEENEEKDSDLMENYHKLSRGVEKLKEYKKNFFHHKELYSNLNSQVQQRRKQLFKELLFLFPIDKREKDNYSISGVYLPNSDVLADCSDTGLAVALGYVAHILNICSTFLQVPLRYPIIHYGSRSLITDQVSLLPEKERDFPLFTRGKDKAHFTYAVYLLNKNLAQFRWLLNMTTPDLRQTLYNLQTFLQGPREVVLHPPEVNSRQKNTIGKVDVRLQSFSCGSNLADPILDFIRQEAQEQQLQQQRNNSPSRKSISSVKSKNSECGRGLGEILAIPEAYMNRKISSDSFKSFVDSDKRDTAYSKSGLIKITNGKEIDNCLLLPNNIEQGTDPLNSPLKLSPTVSELWEEHPQMQVKTEAEDTNKKHDSGGKLRRSTIANSIKEGSQAIATPLQNHNSPPEKEDNPSLISEELNTPSCSGEEILEGVLIARADALCATKSFNLMRPKP